MVDGVTLFDLILSHSLLVLLLSTVYNNRCSDCIDIQPEWNRLAADWDGHLVGQVAQVDCDDEQGQTQVICEYFQIQVGDNVHKQWEQPRGAVPGGVAVEF